MSQYDPQTPVSRFVTDNPATARVFERWGIDYCCGGKLPLADVCRRKGLDAGAVLQALIGNAAAAPGSAARSWADAPLGDLVTHIVDVHHGFLHKELPRLVSLADKVAGVHGERHPELVEVRLLVHQLASEMDLHMQKEERILFPMIRELGGAGRPRAFHCGSVSNPIRVMEMEHEDAGRALARLREITGEFTPPADACGSYRALLAGIADVEADLHEHVHEENNILFPRAEEIERSVPAAGA
jgi:regulator of cell morphogenesis and NO signaling